MAFNPNQSQKIIINGALHEANYRAPNSYADFSLVKKEARKHVWKDRLARGVKGFFMLATGLLAAAAFLTPIGALAIAPTLLTNAYAIGAATISVGSSVGLNFLHRKIDRSYDNTRYKLQSDLELFKWAKAEKNARK